MKKRICALVLTFLLTIGGSANVSAATINQVMGDNNILVFVDVPNTHWAYSDIEYFSSQGIVNGIGKDQFAPDDGVTRESFCKMLVLTFTAPLESPPTPTFTDLDSNRWSYPYVEACRNFLTGYASPFDSTMTFRPETMATREDIAVALVRMMGLTDADAENPTAYTRFRDASQISPQLTGYVSVAVEQGLINGRADGNFAPQASISRAETVTLLSRASKSAVTNVNADIKLETKIVYNSDGTDATLYVTAPRGTAVTVDGKSIKMTAGDSNTVMIGTALYSFESEGTHTFQINAAKGGKNATSTAVAKYEIAAPVLKITSCPTTVTSKNVTIFGTMYDKNYPTELLINGESIATNSYADYRSSWSKNYTLTEGKNTFEFILKNSNGKTSIETRTVNLNTGVPTLKIISCPTSVTSKDVTIFGTIYDKNYSTELLINGESVAATSYADYTGSWTRSYTLTESNNKFKFVLKNSNGKTVTETRDITFNVGVPVLKITSCPTSVTSKNITISGTMYDKNYSTELLINGESVATNQYGDYTNSWSKNYTLTEGENKFEFVLKNDNGKTVTEVRTVDFDAGVPTLKITSCPTSVTSKDITISGTMYDKNYATELLINGESVATNRYGDYINSWSKNYTLSGGENKIEFVLRNDNGKTITETRTIIYSPET